MDSTEDEIYYETMCRNNISQGAKIVDQINFIAGPISRLNRQKIKIEFSKVNEVFKFYQIFDSIRNRNTKYEITDPPIYNFKLNYLFNSKVIQLDSIY